MYNQYEYLREGVSMVRNQTYRIDLPETGLLSSLLLKVTGSTVSGATLADELWRILDFIDSIEIIGNGATVIKSLEGKHFHFLNWLHQGIVPPHFWRNYATNTQFEYFLVNFGRFLGDPDYGLDLARWDNVELRVTNTATATYYGSDFTLSILQSYLRDTPGGFRGYLRSELWREWTTVQNETKYFTLPTEYPISTLALRALPDTTAGLSDTGFSNLMDDIDFSIQGGTKQVYKGGLDDLIVMNYLERGAEVITSGEADVNADRGIDVGIGRMFGWSGISGSRDGAVSATIPTMLGDATDNTVAFETREADSPVEFMVRGMGFQNTGYLVHAHDLDPAKMIDPRQVGDVRLNIRTRDTAASADGTNQVILERLVSS